MLPFLDLLEPRLGDNVKGDKADIVGNERSSSVHGN